MPYVKIQTNIEKNITIKKSFLSKVSQLVGEQLQKSEQYIMVAIEQNNLMLFAGNDAPLAYIELKSIGLPSTAPTSLSQSLCALVEEELGIHKDRIYIEFKDVERNNWGWNGTTF